jgi:hypothetical protein
MTCQFHLEFRPSCVGWVWTQLFSESTAAATNLTKTLVTTQPTKLAVQIVNMMEEPW